jgi:integrase
MKQRGVFERKLGEWWIRYTDAQGRYRREKAGTWAAARDLYVKRKNEALVGRKLPEKLRRAPVLFDEIARDALAWSDEHKRSAANDHYRMKKLLNWFGGKPVDSITSGEIEAHLQSESWKPATWNRMRALLSMIYRIAIRNGKTTANPVRLVPSKAAHNERVRFLSPDEEKRLRTAIARKFPERLAEFDLALHTGMRRSEQYGARWEQVDWERRILTVPLDKGGRTSYVPLNAGALRALTELLRRTADSGFICGGSRSSRWWFEEAVKDAKITGFTWHSIRHTFASRLVMSGADVRTVAELLRDRTLAMVMRYAHLAPDYKLEALHRMESKFGVPTDTTIAPKANEKPQQIN